VWICTAAIWSRRLFRSRFLSDPVSVDQISPEMGKVFGIHFLVGGETRNSCAIEAQGVVLITVGLSADAGLAQAMKEKLAEEGSTVRIEAPRARCTPEPWVPRLPPPCADASSRGTRMMTNLEFAVRG
jgi:hypothetical protein